MLPAGYRIGNAVLVNALLTAASCCSAVAEDPRPSSSGMGGSVLGLREGPAVAAATAAAAADTVEVCWAFMEGDGSCPSAWVVEQKCI